MGSGGRVCSCWGVCQFLQSHWLFIFRSLSQNSEVKLTSFSLLLFLLPIFTLKAQLEKKRDDFCKQNQEASSGRCSALLQDIFSPLEEEVKMGIYSKPGGYRLFIQKLQDLKKKYHEEPRKGIQVTKIYLSVMEICWPASYKHQGDQVSLHTGVLFCLHNIHAFIQ